MMSVRRMFGLPLAGVLRYLGDEYSFIFDVLDQDELELRAVGGTTSISIDTLQIEVGVQSKAALYVWGFHPRDSWEAARLIAPEGVPGTAIIDVPYQLEPGVSIAVPDGRRWVTEYDPQNGWVRISASRYLHENLVEIASGVMLGELEGELVAVWLHPVFCA
jgi:hypothetical protein